MRQVVTRRVEGLMRQGCACKIKCEGAGSDTCHGSHGYRCRVTYWKAMKVLDDAALPGDPKRVTFQGDPPGEALSAAAGADGEGAAAGPGDHPLLEVCRRRCPDAETVGLEELRRALCEADEADASGKRSAEMQKHIEEGHMTVLPSGTRCAECLFAKMIEKPARKGSTRLPHGMMTCCVDTNDMVRTSVNGNRYYTGQWCSVVWVDAQPSGVRSDERLGLDGSEVAADEALVRGGIGSRGHVQGAGADS